ncbi:hypothetical protein PMAYCL1PPCAC_20013 [Pristionchus mayeri]|uniref:DUF7758 domain-containing protein n=1 Tax=Pristionchus mayeri TaxID=1317129 RepID=A0AAN5CSA3_9BILA|nr:hypothetical protein PMAYCL1PPCAC_20013 [Pristionchus mayeri]
MSTVSPAEKEMGVHCARKRLGFAQRLRRIKNGLLVGCFAKYRRCVTHLKKYLVDETTSKLDSERRRSHAKLQPPPDRPIRKVVASKISRKPTNELERLRKKGDNWTANDLFRFQYGDPEEGEPEERKRLCEEWLDRLQAIPKKYCYLAWYASAVYACYYRLAPLLTEPEAKRKCWEEVKQEYAEIFVMGRRIWRRPMHPSRLHVFYDLAMLCTRFGSVADDPTIARFKLELKDSTNFDFKVLNEVEFANSIEKVISLENFVIDQFYSRRRSTCSSRSSFRSRRSTITDHSPTRRCDKGDETDREDNDLLAANSGDERPKSSTEVVTEAIERLSLAIHHPETSASPKTSTAAIPTIVVDGCTSRSSCSNSAPTSRNNSRPTSRKSSLASTTAISRPTSPKPSVRFEEEKPKYQ